MSNEHAYLDLLRTALERGVAKHDRTGVGTYSLFAPQLRFDLGAYPLLTTKRVNWTAVWAELRWMLHGLTNVRALEAKIWDPWADDNGDLGPVYGAQWRSWPTPDGRTIDQIVDAESRLIANPDDRRIIVSAWNVAELERMSLPPCHLLFQFYTHEVAARGGSYRVLSTHVYQRSADLFVGVPFNIASYALLTRLMTERVEMVPGELVFSFGDAHLYRDHVDAARRQLGREPGPPPEVVIDPEVRDLQHLGKVGKHHAGIRGYDPHPAIRVDVAT